MAINYKTESYLIPMCGTIEAAIRHFNDQSINKETLYNLVEIFTKINPDAAPPRFGQQVLIPILLNQENNNVEGNTEVDSN